MFYEITVNYHICKNMATVIPKKPSKLILPNVTTMSKEGYEFYENASVSLKQFEENILHKSFKQHIFVVDNLLPTEDPLSWLT